MRALAGESALNTKAVKMLYPSSGNYKLLVPESPVLCGWYGIVGFNVPIDTL